MSKRLFSRQRDGLTRRDLLLMAGATATLASYSHAAKSASGGLTIVIDDVKHGEDVFAYISRKKGGFDQAAYQQVIGAANDFKEGDQAIGVGAADEASRRKARALLSNTKIKDLYQRPLFEDDLQKLIWQTTDQAQYEHVKDWTMGQLTKFLITETEEKSKLLWMA